MSGYPYLDDERLRRNPYEERVAYGLDRVHDPYSTSPSRVEEDRNYRPRYEREPIPPVTLNGSPRQLERERNRPWVAEEERRGPYASYLRHSQSPPPPKRSHRRNVDPFAQTFGDLERSARGGSQEPTWGAEGPRRDPFSRERQESPSSNSPYGGGRPPRDPFRLGGDHYNYERQYGRRHDSLEPPDRSGFDDQARRRDEGYRARIADSWGLAEFSGYERRRHHEEAMTREHQREEDRRVRREEERRDRG